MTTVTPRTLAEANLTPPQVTSLEVCNHIAALLLRPRHLYNADERFQLDCAVAFLKALELSDIELRMQAIEAQQGLHSLR